MTYIDKLLKGRIRPFFLFKLVFSKQLVSTIGDERLEMADPLEEEITDG